MTLLFPFEGASTLDDPAYVRRPNVPHVCLSSARNRKTHYSLPASGAAIKILGWSNGLELGCAPGQSGPDSSGISVFASDEL
jgi:hypothetical protein